VALMVNDDQKNLLQHLRTLWHWGDSLFRRAPDGPALPSLKCTWLLGLVVHRYVRAALAEVDGGSYYGLSLLLRSCVEASINLDFIFCDGTKTHKRAAAFLLDGDRTRLKEVNKLIELFKANKPGKNSEYTTLDWLESTKARALASIAAGEAEDSLVKEDWPMQMDQRARAAGDERYEEYLLLYGPLALDAHALPMSRTRKMSTVGGSSFINLSPSEGELEARLSALLDYYVRILEHLHLHAGALAIPAPLPQRL